MKKIVKKLKLIAMTFNDIKTKILIIEDDRQIRKLLNISLSSDIYQLIEASDGQNGLICAAQYNPDLVLLDLGLPDMEGLEVLKNLRDWTTVPVIIISARLQEKEKVLCLDNGADDYLTKPFGIEELQARIRVALRNKANQNKEEAVYQNGILSLDFVSRKVFVQNKEIHLTPIEYKLLTVLVKNAGKVVTHGHLLKEVWGLRSNESTQYLRVYMTHLRKKIEAVVNAAEIFETEVGIGYRLIIWDDGK